MTRREPCDAGTAAVEFLALTLVLLIPLACLAVTVCRLQAAALGGEAAARQAARVLVLSDDPDAGLGAARAAVAVALSDQGFAVDPAAALTVTCSDDPCGRPGGTVTATVRLTVDLPFVPGFLADAVPLTVPVQAQRTAVVDDYRDPS